jgi:hypothetical protein
MNLSRTPFHAMAVAKVMW